MKEISNQDLKAITEAHTSPMISIYLSSDNEERAITDKWKESLSKAEYYLLKDYTRSFIDAFMEPLRHDTCINNLEVLDKGIIVFYSEKEKGYLRVQSPISDLTVVADSFHIKPLLRIKSTEKGFFLITINTKIINLLVETSGHLYRMESFKNEASQSGDMQIAKDFIAKAAAEINKTITGYKLPIILAGVKDNLGHMRKHIDHGLLMSESIVGNVEKMQSDELRSKCFEIMEPYYFRKEIESIQELNFAVRKNYAITYIEDIALSAVSGKVKKLFVVESKQLWGSINKRSGEVYISPRQIDSHDDDILDDLCQIVLERGGDVVVLKDDSYVDGYVAAAIVSDKSHLYDYDQSYFLPEERQ